MRRWYEIRAGADGVAEILIYDDIGGSWWNPGLMAKDFIAELAELDAEKIDIRINSRGGSVYEGAAIYNAIKRHEAEITTHIDGAALSIASVIALGGDRVVMSDTSWFMIHEPWGGVIGNAEEMRKEASVLDKISEVIRNVYVGKTGKDAADISAAMGEETWYTAQEALDAGFIDEIGAGGDASIASLAHDFAAYRYRNVPDILRAGQPLQKPEPTAEERDPAPETGTGDIPVTLDPRVAEVFFPTRHRAPEDGGLT